MQYFERAVFEMHPENPRPYDVLLTLLGREKFLAKYPGGNTTPQPSPTPTPSAAPSSAPPAPTLPRTASTSQVALTVHEVRDNVPPSFSKPATGHRFVGIDVTLRNVGTNEFSNNILYFRLRAADGRDYSVVFVGVPQPQVQLQDLRPRDDTRGWITFTIPDGLQLVRLTFDHTLLDDPVTVSLP